MIYKSGIKEFLIMLFVFGGCMGLFFGLAYGVVYGVVGGLASGLIYAGIITLITRLLERKFNQMRKEIAADRRIICDGGATWQGIGGWMFFTEAGLEFYPHKINHAQKSFAIPTEELCEVTVSRNMITVALTNGTSVSVVVSKNREWKKQLDEVLSAREAPLS